MVKIDPPTSALGIALTPDSVADTAFLARAVTEIMGSPDPSGALFEVLKHHHEGWALQFSKLLFEAVIARTKITNYWVLHRMVQVYAELNENQGAFFCATLAIQMEPESDSWHLYSFLFKYFCEKDLPAEALDIFSRHIEVNPENPIAWPSEIEALSAKAGLRQPLAADEGIDFGRQGRIDIRVQEKSAVELPKMAAYGRGRPYSFTWHTTVRPSIDVAEISDAELLISNHTVVVREENGRIHSDISVCKFPEIVGRKILAKKPAEDLVLERAVLITDIFNAPNLCHFLLDHLTRLALYEQAGVSIADCCVIGLPIVAEFQRYMVQKLGIKSYLDTGRIARIKVKKLWVSTNCMRDIAHPAHVAAPWAIDYIKRNFASPGQHEAPPIRLYISRADASGRHVRNEAALTALLARAGFTTIIPGEMPFEEQVQLFSRATHVVGVHGAAMTNIVFCPPKAHVLEIFHPLYGTCAYPVLASAVGCDYASFVADDPDSDRPESNDPNLVDINSMHFAGRDVHVELSVVETWLRATITD